MARGRAWLGGRAAVCACAVALVLGCKLGREADDKSSEGGPKVEAAAAMPTSEAEFLAELVPLPGDSEAIEVRYAITGPALSGEMTTSITAGGKRRDAWVLRSTAGDTELRAAGTTIVNAEQIWTANEGEAGEIRDNHLAELARAFMRLEPEARAPVVESIRAWHRLLAEQREESRGDRAEVLGVSCLQTRVAAQNVCMWEETGLLLRYEGSAFTIEATEIDLAAKLEADAFLLPRAAAKAEVQPAPSSGPAYDYDKILDEIAAGSYGKVSVLVVASQGVPTLRLPDAEPKQQPG
ncbi:hypothetical protein ENSA5_64170 [Enhygromyxa salina]|uniref:Lipoprotein n=1 Tax=Enhygromyxa salina TaxID=215803 RepID=A0A2S9XCC2_9BACT|nr:hypothetical protein [Enhygromyxa salina]PRP90502.1 hypothetical protein ENSA5_64170 [Enhygromyxa salina]